MTSSPATAGAAPGPPPAASVARLTVEVEWANIVKASGDVFVVGHYVGVLPQNAEWALDCALSGVAPSPPSGNTRPSEDGRLILTDLTRRGAIRGALGEVLFFPWKERGQIVLAGMGRLGTFKRAQLETLAASLTQCIGRLLPKPTISTVLIGSGYGNLKVPEAVSGLLSGVARTLAADPTIESVLLRIVEYKLDRAYEILEAARNAAQDVQSEFDVDIACGDDVTGRDEGGGTIPIPYGFSLMMASLAQACRRNEGPLMPAVDHLVNELPPGLRAGVRESLERLGKQTNTRQLGLAFRMVNDDGGTDGTIADRVSFIHDGAGIQAAAITNLTTVAATTLPVSAKWIDRIVEGLRAPAEEVLADRGRRAFRSLVHPLLREKLLLDDALVLELDRTTARVPWELVHDGGEPLAIRRPLARQLRTSYSLRPPDVTPRPTWKALIIGDPDGNLGWAQKEAQAVNDALLAHGLKPELRLGPPDALGLGSKAGVDPADLYEVLELLQSGEYDIVHFAGHAIFDPQAPDRSGWKFKDDVLTASMLEGVERVPRLIVANACVSAALSTSVVGGAPGPVAMLAAGLAPNDAGLVASLADEFFRRGVADYIGTAWEVRDSPAEIFANVLYREFLAGWKGVNRNATGTTTALGAAVHAARRALYDRRSEFGEFATVWAAYQHYGDPTRTLADYRA